MYFLISLAKIQIYKTIIRVPTVINIQPIKDFAVNSSCKNTKAKKNNEFLTPLLCDVSSKEEAINITNKYSTELKGLCLKKLKEKGFNYSVNIKINNEFFPTRTYANTTLESGYYDAVVVELGEAQGDNWWCVMYPPLCFVNKNENTNQIKYKSIICEWFNKLFN